jgi:capsular exopolysaccharide synthesis family protein
MSTLRPVDNADDFAFDDGGAANNGGGGDSPLDWRRYVHAVARRWWIIVLCAAVATAIAGAVTVRQPKLYRAAASLIIDVRGAQVLTGMTDVYDVGGRGWAPSAFFQTEYEIMKSRRVARAAALRAGMVEDDRFTGLVGVTDDAIRQKRLESLDPADLAMGRYTIEPDKSSNVVRVVVVHEDADHAANLANAVADAYLDVNLDKRVDNTKDASDWLITQNDELRRKLKASDDALLKFMADNGVLNASLESQLEEVKQRLSAFNSALATEEGAQIRDVLNVKALEQVRQDPSLLDTLPEVQSASIVSSFKQKLLELRTLEMEAQSKYLPEHPKMKLLVEQRAVLEKDLQREIQALLTSLERQKASREASIAGLREALNVERSKEARLNNLAIAYNQLKRERDTDQKLFDMVSSRIKEADITGAQPFNNVRFLDRALVPKAPFKPNLQQALLAALVAGLALGVGVALLIELLDTTVKSQADLEALVKDAPFLGMMPVIPIELGTDAAKVGDRHAQLKQTQARDLYILGNPRSAVAECARFIRTNLLFMSPDRPLRTLVVTSPAPQEGKTTTAVTTAISMAQAGSRTLIVDTDMRKPRLHRVFSVDQDIGVANILLGEATVDDAIVHSSIPNLDVLPCGTLPPNPAELLLSDRFKELVRELSGRYERVVFDTPPMGPVTDPAILGTLVDGVVLVTKCDKTSKESVKQAMRALRDANARVFGVILNDVDVTAKRYAGAYYAYYRRYGGYYGDDDKADGAKGAKTSGDKAAE